MVYISASVFRFVALALRALRGSTPNYSVIIRYNNNDNRFINLTFSGWGELTPYTKLGKLVYYRYITAASVKSS